MRVEEKDAAYCLIGYATIWKHEGDRVTQLGLQLEGEVQQRYFRKVIGECANVIPSNLFRLLDKLPSKKARSQAAVALARGHDWQHVLSDTELETVMSYLYENDAKQLKQRMRDIEKQSQ